MQKSWQLQEAKNKLSEVVDDAIQDGPQVITKRGVEVAVVLSYPEFLKLKKEQGSLYDFFRKSPLAGVDLERDSSAARPDLSL
jgi:prevent-host-death family protein